MRECRQVGTKDLLFPKVRYHRPPIQMGITVSQIPVQMGMKDPPTGGDERPPLQVGIKDPHTDSTPGELFKRWSFGPSKKSSPGGFLLTPGFWIPHIRVLKEPI